LTFAIASSIRSYATIGGSGPKISSRINRDVSSAPIASVGASLRPSAKLSPAGLTSMVCAPARRRARWRGSQTAQREKTQIS
jgi:hypothetical protein